MNKKTKFFSSFVLSLAALFLGIAAYLQGTKSLGEKKIEDKNIFISVVGLPDTALSTEGYYIRHRSLVNMRDIFSDAPEHIEYFPSTFSISYGKIK